MLRSAQHKCPWLARDSDPGVAIGLPDDKNGASRIFQNSHSAGIHYVESGRDYFRTERSRFVRGGIRILHGDI